MLLWSPQLILLVWCIDYYVGTYIVSSGPVEKNLLVGTFSPPPSLPLPPLPPKYGLIKGLNFVVSK